MISLALLLLPAVISAQVFGVLEVYDFDDNVEVALFVFAILGLMHALQTTLKQSFTVGESYLVSSLLISSLYAAWSYRLVQLYCSSLLHLLVIMW